LTGAGRSGADWQPAIAAAIIIDAAEAAMRALIIPISSPRNDWIFFTRKMGECKAVPASCCAGGPL
jgi:hypothetical protein